MNDDMPDGTDQGAERLEGMVVAGRYRVEHVVSSGANTVITEAIDVRDDVPVTLKVVQPERAVHASFRADFRTCVTKAAALSHPNIAKVLDWGEMDLRGEPTVFWVVEYLGGGSLRDLFDRGRLLAPSQALVVGLEACRALDAAHTAGIVHTEVTPSKLVFGADARLRIVDFAMAELLGADSWAEPARLATHVARYASPEQALRLEVDAKTDVYALALCLIEAITGTVPFGGDSTVSTLAARVGKLMPVTADMGSLAAVLERAGRPEGEDRWTAAGFGAALVQAAETLPRPEPIPIMASSLFATSLLQRTTPTPIPTPTPTPEPEPAAEPLSPPGDETVEIDEADAPAAEAVGDDPLVIVPDVADLPTGDVPTGDVPSADVPTGDVPTGDVPTGDVPTGDVPTGDVEASRRTEQLPAAAAAAAAAATTRLDTVDPTPSGTFYDAEQDARPWGRYAAIGLLVAVGLTALGIAAFLLLRTESYEVPDLVGVDQAVALNEIAGNGWVIETDRERSDDVAEVDHVVRTIPAAGEMLAEGETFVLVVSDGPELRSVPELVGVPLAEAQSRLADLRLGLAELEREFSEDVPAESIIRWQVQGNASLVAGAQVLPGTVVEVVVSLGPEPRPAPDLTNLTLDEATAALAALQLEIVRGDDEFSDTIEVGRVVVQDPAPATPVDRGGAVSVRISKGPDLVPFPDLTGQLYPQALETLAAAGFTENSLLGTTEGTFVSASVNGEEVSAGATFPRGTAVDLIFL